MNKILSFFVVLIVGEYVLNEMTKDKKIILLPTPYGWIRDKVFKSKEVLGK